MTTSTIDPRLIVTTETVAGYRVAEVLGTVRGASIRARHVGSDIVASLRSVVGGEVKEYARLMGGTREQAFDRMTADALDRGANGIVGLRFATSMVMQGAAEVLAYGTAVRLEPEPFDDQ
ncbi:MAG: YbjQ family protein [Pseudomonadota bacterium]